LQQSCEAHERNEDWIRQENPVVQSYWRVQIGAFEGDDRERLSEVPGFSDLRTFALATWGEDLTPSVCGRIIGLLVKNSRGTLSAEDAEQLSLSDAAPRLAPAAPEGDRLKPIEQAVLSIIQRQEKGKGIQGKEIIAALKMEGIDLKESTLRRHTVQRLKQKYGLQNIRAAGGYLIPGNRS
jgi:hypothetical protein